MLEFDTGVDSDEMPVDGILAGIAQNAILVRFMIINKTQHTKIASNSYHEAPGTQSRMTRRASFYFTLIPLLPW
jgi:hypothetical protein